MQSESCQGRTGSGKETQPHWRVQRSSHLSNVSLTSTLGPPTAETTVLSAGGPGRLQASPRASTWPNSRWCHTLGWTVVAVWWGPPLPKHVLQAGRWQLCIYHPMLSFQLSYWICVSYFHFTNEKVEAQRSHLFTWWFRVMGNTGEVTVGRVLWKPSSLPRTMWLQLSFPLGFSFLICIMGSVSLPAYSCLSFGASSVCHVQPPSPWHFVACPWRPFQICAVSPQVTDKELTGLLSAHSTMTDCPVAIQKRQFPVLGERCPLLDLCPHQHLEQGGDAQTGPWLTGQPWEDT